MRSLAAFFIAVICLGCDRAPETASLKTGPWRAVIDIQGHDLPFNFEVVKDSSRSYDVFIRNAEEKLLLDDVTVDGDSVNMALHIFDANIKARISGDSLTGVFVKNYEANYRLPFRARFGDEFRFEQKGPAGAVSFTGKYQVRFTTPKDTTDAVGIFNQQGDKVTGTFLTATGDYRYLEGNVINDRMQLSTFDGNHAYIFYATREADGALTGEFYSGKSGFEQWTAVENENATLVDAESLTYLKPGYDRIDFSFPDVDGNKISLHDPKYEGKVVILQLFGTWCPNCMDETRFLAPWYEQNEDRGVEVIGLAYERKADFGYASDRVRKMIDKFDVPYDFVIAGTNNKEEAAKTLPMLNTVVAFPTTIFIGKDGKVKKIHTGFSGPGTGKYYQEFVDDFNETVNSLLSEPI